MSYLSKKITLCFLTNIISFCIASLYCQETNTLKDTNIVVPQKHTATSNSSIPNDYKLIIQDDFHFFNTDNWSKGLTHDTDASIKMIWNKKTGGKNLLNGMYAGYIVDQNTYIKDGAIYFDNKKETVQGVDPAKVFEYTTGWMNSLNKINFNGTKKDIYLQIKAKFPKGDKVWPAIWLIDDSKKRSWPPEIDIWEYFGRFFKTPKKDQMYMRFIYGKWNKKEDHSVPINNFQKEYNASTRYHTYGYQWTKDTMKWFIDGELVHRKTKGIEVPKQDWPNKTMCLVINNGLLTQVAEGNTVFPNSLIIDSLELYQKK